LKLAGKSQHKFFNGTIYGIKYLLDQQNYSKQYLFALGDEISSSKDKLFIIKIFSTSDMSKPLQAFPAIMNVPDGVIPTSFAVHFDGSQIAVGFSNGAVSVFVGNFLKDTSSRSSLLNITPQVSLPSTSQSVTGLHFCDMPLVSSKPNDRRIHLFVVFHTSAKSESESTLVNGESKGIIVLDTSVTVTLAGPVLSVNRKSPFIADSVGADAMCSSYMPVTRELVVCRKDGVYSYTVDDRGGAASLDGQKHCVLAVSRYVLVGSTDEKSGKISLIRFILAIYHSLLYVLFIICNILLLPL
jgi:hypothetical protein